MELNIDVEIIFYRKINLQFIYHQNNLLKNIDIISVVLELLQCEGFTSNFAAVLDRVKQLYFNMFFCVKFKQNLNISILILYYIEFFNLSILAFIEPFTLVLEFTGEISMYKR